MLFVGLFFFFRPCWWCVFWLSGSLGCCVVCRVAFCFFVVAVVVVRVSGFFFLRLTVCLSGWLAGCLSGSPARTSVDMWVCPTCVCLSCLSFGPLGAWLYFVAVVVVDSLLCHEVYMVSSRVRRIFFLTLCP